LQSIKDSLMAILLTILHGIGTYAALLEHGLAKFGGQVRRYREGALPGLPLPNAPRSGERRRGE
jgi:hypothetical protein